MKKPVHVLITFNEKAYTCVDDAIIML